VELVREQTLKPSEFSTGLDLAPFENKFREYFQPEVGELYFTDWGLIDYSEALERQMTLVEKVASGEMPDTVVFCSHPPVVTLGRSSKPQDLTGWQGDLIEVSRGGRATYHGPNQLVIYPILNLSRERKSLKVRDIGAYLRSLESILIDVLGDVEILANAKTIDGVDESGDKISATGVWVGDKKIASIGIAVKKWVTYHGLALNVRKDPLAFQGLRPCGFNANIMTSIEEVLSERST